MVLLATQGVLAFFLLVSTCGGDASSEAAQASETSAVRGVAAEDQDRFACSVGTCVFRCSSWKDDESWPSLPRTAVNDDFCDCDDGSDEPGTAACAGRSEALFYCSNTGAVPKYVYTSRVGDGVCDCCDGSDEQRPGREQEASPCANTCADDAAERQQLLDRLQKGLDRHVEIRQAGKLARTEWESELNELKEALPALQEAHEAAKKVDMPPNVAKRFEEVFAMIKTMQETIQQQQAELSELRAAFGKKCTTATGDDGHPASIESEKQAAESTSNSITTDTVPEDQAPQKVVSEYAKWMDNSEKILSAETKHEEEPASKSGPSEESGSEQAAPTASIQEALEKVETNQNRTTQLEGYLQSLPADRMAFYSLLDKCLEKTDGEYNYKICFFSSAYQDDVSLGTWNGWIGRLRAEFTEGTKCWNGPERKLIVKFRCGADEEIVDVVEPSSCEYEATVLCPGACGKKTAAEVQRGMAGVKPRMPKDEL